MPEKFHTIGLIGKHGDASPRATILELGRFLLERGHRVLLEERTASRTPDHQITAVSLADLGAEADLAIVVGGDGTLLHTARSLADYEVPLLGINLGRLGFLTDISPREMLTTLEQIFSGEYREESRFLLNAEIDGARYTAFNDVVVHKWNTARMIEFETYIDGCFVNVQRSDGIIVATPTGSTAYALSGGGPLLHTGLNATLLVPICPHTLSNRPLVVDGDSEIEIVVCDPLGNRHLRITCDGQTSLPLQGDRVTIRKYEHPVRLIHPVNHDHFYILRTKLGWSEHHSILKDK